MTAFADWKADFLTRSRFPPDLADHLTHGQAPTANDANQAEVRQTLRDYLRRVVSDTRIARGRDLAHSHKPLLDTLEHRFPVPREVLLAIWGIETNFGDYMGDIPVFTALSSLAHQGRRRALFETQLLAAARMVTDYGVPTAKMVGSWAGAMGHTQFMPASWCDFAVGLDGGQADIWGQDPADALCSAAHYLTQHGWQRGMPWGAEAMWEAGLDLYSARHRDATSTWQGITPLSACATPARFILPAGHKNPGFLVTPNYDALLRYNNSDAYALGVAYLADHIAGRSGVQTPWDDTQAALTQGEVKELQTALTAQGFDTKGRDGLTGPNTIAAIEGWQIKHHQPVDGHADRALLNAVLGTLKP